MQAGRAAARNLVVGSALAGPGRTPALLHLLAGAGGECRRGGSLLIIGPASGSWNRLDLGEEFDRLEGEGIVRGDAVEELRATGFRDGYLRTLPGVHPCDGFFAALIERR